MPWFDELTRIDAIEPLKEASRGLIKTRNGFDHAWTGKRLTENNDTIKNSGMDLIEKFKIVIGKIQ